MCLQKQHKEVLFSHIPVCLCHTPVLWQLYEPLTKYGMQIWHEQGNGESYLRHLTYKKS